MSLQSVGGPDRTVPTEEELVERAKGLFPLLRQNVRKADADRRLPEENIQAITEAGLWRTWVPRRYGGYEAPVRTAVRITTELSRADPATGWCVGMMNTVGYLAAMLPAAVQDEIFADPNVRFAGVFSPPPNPVQKVDGGYVFTGNWPFASGCLHSTWSCVPAPVVGEDGAVVGAVLGWAPTADFEIKDTWHVLGMRGTGSNTLSADGLFIPEERVLDMMGPAGILESQYPSEYRDSEPLYRIPVGMIASTVTGIPCLGMAKAAMDRVLERLPSRSVAYSKYTRQVESVTTQVAVAEAATEADLAEMLFHRAADDLDAIGEAGGPPADWRHRTRVRNDACYAAQLCMSSVRRLALVTGASSMADAEVMQQLYRDVSTATSHGALQTSQSLEVYGAALCGEPPTSTFLV